MEIAIFSEVTTEQALIELEETAKDYTGLYVDMSDKEQRKYVNDKAALINDLLKKIDRTRIDTAKAYKTKVEAEAKAITTRLIDANKPFTLLIDDWKAERKRVLDAEKAHKAAVELAAKIESDHEFALAINEAETLKAKIAKQDAIEAQEKLETEMVERAKKEIEAQEQARLAHEESERLKRVNDRENISRKRTETKIDLMQLGLDEDTAKKIVLAVSKKQIRNLTINY